MPILKVTDTTPIGMGKFVHAKSKLPYGTYSEGRKVTGFGGTQRILYEKEGKETFMLRKDVLLVCDTQDEAAAVLDNSVERNKDIRQRIDWVLEEVGHQYNARLNVLIGASNKA
jgi:hypothetical protein